MRTGLFMVLGGLAMVVGGLTAVLIAIFNNAIADELRDVAPKITDRVLASALQMVPKSLREAFRLAAEKEVNKYGGRLVPLFLALYYLMTLHWIVRLKRMFWNAFARFARLSAAASALSVAAFPAVEQDGLRAGAYLAYGLGTVMTVHGIAGAKWHADNPTSTLAPALGKLGAGATFLAAPTVVSKLLYEPVKSESNDRYAVSSFDFIGF